MRRIEYFVLICVMGLALAATAQAGNNNGSGGNHNGNRSQSMSFQGSSNKWKQSISQFGKNDHHDNHDDHHGHQDHHDHHYDHHHNRYPRVVPYPYPQPYPVAVPVVVSPPVVPTIPQGGPNLVEGVNLVLVDVRMVDVGDAARNLGPRYRIVVGNRGNRPAGNFQVLAIAAEDATLNADLPNTMVDVEGVAAGRIAKVEIRLPTRAMTMLDGNPFNLLAVVVDANKLIDETAEQDNSGMTARTKIKMLEAQ